MPPRRTRSKVPLIIAVIAVAVVLLAAGGYLLLHKSPKPAHTARQTPATHRVAPSSQSAGSGTLHYVSNGKDLNLNFDYPNSWTVTPASNDNSNDGIITLNSPLTTIESAAGSSVTGKVTATIRPASSQLSELSSGAVASQASVQFAYSKPASDQYQYPYLGFIHLLGGNDSNGAFEEVLVSGNTTFTQGETVNQDTVQPDPIITARFYSCSTTACTGPAATPLSITNATWLNGTVFQQTLALFKSMQLN